MLLSLAQRVRGGLLGLAVGDALGAPLEFMTVSEIFARYGVVTEMLASPERRLKPGETTDDTAMALAVAQGIIACPEDPIEEVGKLFLSWYYRDGKGIGNQVRRVFETYEVVRDWTAAAQQVAKELKGLSAGNGCLMRTLPISYVYCRQHSKMLEISERICRMTHYDDQAVASCLFYNDLVCRLLGETEKWEAYRQSLQALKEYRDKRKDNPAAVADFDKVISVVEAIDKVDASSFYSNGYVVKTLAAAVWCWLHGDSFERVLISAVNMGGDTDTIGAVAGGLAGTEYGAAGIPERWLNTLMEREKIDEVAVKIVGLVNR